MRGGPGLRRLASGVALAAAALAGCRTTNGEMRRAERLYEEGKFKEAHDVYRAAAEEADDPRLRYNVANALYRMRRYETAARIYRETLADAGPELRPRTAYNLGNAYFRAAEEATERKVELLERAVLAYEEALRLDPRDADAKWNLELSLRRLDEQAARGSRGRPGLADYGRGDNREEGYEGDDAQVGAMAGGGFGDAQGESAEELSESEARRLLEAVEREQLTSHQGRRLKRGGEGERDW